jgi:hypothetical protein
MNVHFSLPGNVFMCFRSSKTCMAVHMDACSGELISEIARYFRCVLKTLPDLHKRAKTSSFTTSSVLPSKENYTSLTLNVSYFSLLLVNQTSLWL